MLLQQLFAKLVAPYVEQPALASLTDLHSLFWQQLPEVVEQAKRPQADAALVKLQRAYRQFVSFVLYPELTKTTQIAIFGETTAFLQAYELDWYELKVPLFLSRGAEQVTGVNLFQSQQTFTFEELCVIPDEFSHLLQHIHIQSPLLTNSNLSFYLPIQTSHLQSEYQCYFLSDANWSEYLPIIQQQPSKKMLIVNLATHELDPTLAQHVTVLDAKTWPQQLASLNIQSVNHRVLIELDKQFQGYQHALELLLTYEHKQLALNAHDPLRATKSQVKLKQYQQELALWQTFYQRFLRLIGTFPNLAQFEQLHQVPQNSATQVLQAYQKRTDVQAVGYGSHPFEQLLTQQATPFAATPEKTAAFSDFLQQHWQITHTPAFCQTLIFEEGSERDETE